MPDLTFEKWHQFVWKGAKSKKMEDGETSQEWPVCQQFVQEGTKNPEHPPQLRSRFNKSCQKLFRKKKKTADQIRKKKKTKAHLTNVFIISTAYRKTIYGLRRQKLKFSQGVLPFTTVLKGTKHYRMTKWYRQSNMTMTLWFPVAALLFQAPENML